MEERPTLVRGPGIHQSTTLLQGIRIVKESVAETIQVTVILIQGSNWTGVELEEFMNCPYNLAHNRQTRMLADLTLAGCYTGYNSTADQLERDRILLQSAKQNLASMAYFGLTEQQAISQYIFEQTFRLDFANSFDQANATLSAQAIAELTPAQVLHSSCNLR